jgi:hypothetical protein
MLFSCNFRQLIEEDDDSIQYFVAERIASEKLAKMLHLPCNPDFPFVSDLLSLGIYDL